jgi:Protein of unknown function (DUF1579)
MSETPLHSFLADVAGAWAGEESLAASPWSPGGTARGRHAFTSVAGGTAIAQSYVQHPAQGAGLEGHGVWAQDPETGELLWYWFDSIGFPPASPARGRWEPEARRLVMHKTTPRGTQEAAFSFTGGALEHTIAVRLADQADDAFTAVLRARYEREPAAHQGVEGSRGVSRRGG